MWVKEEKNLLMAKNTKKIIQVLAYLASKMQSQALDEMKAYKLLWLADRCHLRRNGRTITGDRYYAMPRGVVPTDAKHLLDGETTVLETPDGYMSQWIAKVEPHKFKAVKSPDLTEFSESDIEVLDRVIDRYGNYSMYDLSELSHKYPEWKKYKDMLLDKNEKNSFPVNMDLMFENADEDMSDLFNQSPEVLETTKEIYHEIYS